MPELPEVETLCRQLQTVICGKHLLAIKIYDQKLAGIANLKVGKVVRVQRIGKTIFLHLDNGYSILIHLRMSGRLLWLAQAEGPKYSRCQMTFNNGNIFLVDPRRFATIKVQKITSVKIRNDVITGFDEKKFMERHATRNVNIKNLMMNPEAIAGIGNIYACEILHRSGISPLRKVSSMTKKEWRKIFCNSRRILKKSIEERGTSISDWRDLYGCKGENQQKLQAYGQEGKRCSMCGGTICRIRQGGRSTYYCPNCQK